MRAFFWRELPNCAIRPEPVCCFCRLPFPLAALLADSSADRVDVLVEFDVAGDGVDDWRTATVSGTPLVDLETSAAGMDAASAKENAAAADLEAPPARRQRTMTVAHAERTAAMQEVFGTYTETPVY